MPQVSIVVPVYNVQRYINRCIISILQQTLSDFEVIFVDDCSTDESASAVRRFARNDSRIIFTAHDRNKGLGAARNTGIGIAKSDYLTFVDSDDFVDANLIAEMVKGCGRGHFDIVETGCRAMDEQDNVLWEYIPLPMGIENLSHDPENLFLVRELGMTQKLWRKSLLERGPRQPERVYWEDIAVVPSFIADAQNLVKIEYAGYNYLQRPTSISNTRSAKHVLDLFRAFECYRTHLGKRGLIDRYSNTFPQHVRNCVQYIIDQMLINSRPERGKPEPLIVLCRVLLDHYLSGRLRIGYLEDPEFDKSIAALILAADANVERMIADTVSHILDNTHVS